jgi:hypothetical protein
MAFPEVFTALQQGTVDGQENPLSVIMAAKFEQVQKHLTLTGHVYSPALFLMNKASLRQAQPPTSRPSWTPPRRPSRPTAPASTRTTPGRVAELKEMFSAINKFPLAAIPFFILAGNLMETGGISRRLVEFAKSLVGGVQGGLPMTCVLTCMIFAAVSGSSVATTFAIGAILIPALIKHGYPALCGRAAGHQRPSWAWSSRRRSR